MIYTADNPIETTHIKSCGKDTPFHLATGFFAILAYPSPNEYDKRDKLVTALYSWRNKQAWKKGYIERKQIDRSLMDIPNQQISGKINLAERRIEKRVTAAEIASHVWLSKIADISVKDGFAKRLKISIDLEKASLIKPNSGKGYSRTRIIEDFAASRNMDPAHIKRAIWGTSKSVLHLGGQYRWALLKVYKKAEALGEEAKPFTWDILYMLMAAEEWVYECVETAEASRIYTCKRNGIDPAKSIKLTFEKP